MKTFLVTNDDGIFAPGLLALVDVLQHFGKVYVIAPDKERSAISQSITLRQPIEAKESNVFGRNVQAWSINGTPTDAIKLGCDVLITSPIDVVFSGMNLGANVGRDLFYSGTVSGAREAISYDIPAVAVSYDEYDIETVDFQRATKRMYEWLSLFLEDVVASRHLWNVNIPASDDEQYRGMRWATIDLNIQRYRHMVSKGPHQRTIYWLTDYRQDVQSLDEQSDLYLLNAHFLTTSTWHPLRLHYEVEAKQQWLEKMEHHALIKRGGY